MAAAEVDNFCSGCKKHKIKNDSQYFKLGENNSFQLSDITLENIPEILKVISQKVMNDLVIRQNLDSSKKINFLECEIEKVRNENNELRSALEQLNFRLNTLEHKQITNDIKLNNVSTNSIIESPIIKSKKRVTFEDEVMSTDVPEKTSEQIPDLVKCENNKDKLKEENGNIFNSFGEHDSENEEIVYNEDEALSASSEADSENEKSNDVCTDVIPRLIVLDRKAGLSIKLISEKYKVSQTSTKKIVDHYEKYKTLKNLSTRGGQRGTTKLDDQLIYRAIRKNPTLSARQIKEKFNLKCSIATIWKRLKDQGFRGKQRFESTHNIISSSHNTTY